MQPMTEEPTETMRDRIAIKVMDAMLADHPSYVLDIDGMTQAEAIAQNAYTVADAMMKERLK